MLVPEGERAEENICRGNTENLPNWKRSTHSRPGSAESPIQDEHKDEQSESHINQIDQHQRQRKY